MEKTDMKKILFCALALILLVSGCDHRKGAEKDAIRLIFDTDFGPDYDDVGALAFLNAMADSGKAEILATVASNKNELVIPSIDVINTWFGRSSMLYGAPKSEGASMGASQHWPDSIVARYPHSVSSTSDAQDAVAVYRKVLSSQPDNSVTIVTVGFLTNLNNLLKSQPDSISPLPGNELVKKKVKILVSMAGAFPSGREFNIFIDSAASKYVCENWPGEIIFSGFETGNVIKTGLKLVASGIKESPVRDVFRISIPLSAEDSMGRSSWDETAALISVYGTDKFFKTVRGRIIVNDDGSNSWKNDPAGRDSYVTMKSAPAEIADFIEARMMHQPEEKQAQVKEDHFITLKPEVLKDKIAGGWAGKMIGVTYGAPTEFHALKKIFEDPVMWKPSDIKGSIWQDDLYVQLTFLMAMDRFGVDAPAKKFQEMFAKAGYPLWHANMMARKNYFDSIFVPLSGSPEYNIHADDIDFQIEADYIGFMCPGMSVKASSIAQRIGHIMNYGDGVYGGIFVAALYSEAFVSDDLNQVIANALKSIPETSDYHKIISDVIRLHKHYPDDWRATWKAIEAKWGDDDICGAGDPFNIDAKLNGAYIVIGLLYGDGDPLKTLEITTRCGQDSDCNPSNALAVLGVLKGFSKLPEEMKEGVKKVGDSIFINTDYSFNKAVESSLQYAQKFILENGGSLTEKKVTINVQEPVSPDPEVSFPDVVYDKTITINDRQLAVRSGSWEEQPVKNGRESSWIASNKKGSSLEFIFEGTGLSVNGNWVRDGGIAEVYLDGKLDRLIDTYYYFSRQEHQNVSIWHVFGLKEGKHSVRVVTAGSKRAEAIGSKIYISGALVFKTAPKKSSGFKLSFE
jgi:inosine-uridine nucleoside N-ribohydrolase